MRAMMFLMAFSLHQFTYGQLWGLMVVSRAAVLASEWNKVGFHAFIRSAYGAAVADAETLRSPA
jgi:hypothetical protein